MKRHVAALLIAALVIILPVTLALAEDHYGHKFIHGTYAVTGTNGALLAPFGFDRQTLEPILGVSISVGPQSWAGTYTFHRNGTVDMDVIMGGIGPAIPGSPLTASSGRGTAKFYYTVAAGGKITFTAVHGTCKNTILTGPASNSVVYYDTNDSWDGVVSPDGKIMHVTWGPPTVLFMTDQNYNPAFACPLGAECPLPTQFIAIGSFTLFRLND